MSGRNSDTVTTVTSIVAIAVVLCVCAQCGIDHTVQKMGLASIAALAGFSARGIITRP